VQVKDFNVAQTSGHKDVSLVDSVHVDARDVFVAMYFEMTRIVQ
jgi:hypothetical protein